MPPKTALEERKSLLLEHAKTGSLEAVAALKKLAESPQEQDLDICSALMPRLNLSLIPTPDKAVQDASCLQNLWVAGEAFQAIASICQNRDHLDPVLPPNYLPLFLEYRHHLFRWMEFFQSQKFNLEFYRSLCTVTISTLLELHKDLKSAILTTPSNVDAILLNWITQDVFSGDSSERMWNEGPCSSFFILETVFRHEEGKLILDDIFMTTPSKAQAFAKALISRASDLATRRAGKVDRVSSTFSSVYLHELLHLSSLFVKHQAGRRALLSSSTLFSASASTLLRVTGDVAVRQSTEVWCSVVKCLSAFFDLSFVQEQGTVSPLHRVSAALQGGILQTVCRCLVRLPLTDHNFNVCAGMLGCLITCAMLHRPSLKHFLAAKPKAMDTVAFILLRSQSPLVRRYIRDFEITIEPILHTMGAVGAERVKRMGICDNINHSTSSWANPQVNRPKECSRCHAALYCSGECQRHDWDKFHRDECGPETKMYQDWEELGTPLAPPSRLQVLAYLEFFFGTNFWRGAGEGIRKRRGYPEDCPLVVILDRTTLQPVLNATTPDLYKVQILGQSHCPPYRKKRIIACLGLSQGQCVDSGSEMHYFELILAYGLQWKLHVFASIRQRDGAFHAPSLCSVFWVSKAQTCA